MSSAGDSQPNEMQESPTSAEPAAQVANRQSEFVAVVTALQFSSPIYLANVAKTDGLQHTSVRSLYWRIFLSQLPLDQPESEWKKLLLERRAGYATLKANYIKEPAATPQPPQRQGSGGSSPVSNSLWTQSYADQRLAADIRNDLRRLRLNWCEDFFSGPELQTSLLHILFIWSRINASISYRQGIHELLACIYWVVATDATPAAIQSSLPDDEFFTVLFDSSAVEADVFCMFSYLMDIVKPLFHVQARAWSRPISAASSTAKDVAVVGEQQVQLISQICNDIQHIILETEDKQLHDHLKGLDIEPQVYLIRWTRLLFQREFYGQNAMIVWDFLFARHFLKAIGHRGGADLLTSVREVAVSMLMAIRSLLLVHDASSALQPLMKYPQITNISQLLKNAETVHMRMEKRAADQKRPGEEVNRTQPNFELGQKVGQAFTGFGGFLSRAINSLAENDQRSMQPSAAAAPTMQPASQHSTPPPAAPQPQQQASESTEEPVPPSIRTATTSLESFTAPSPASRQSLRERSVSGDSLSSMHTGRTHETQGGQGALQDSPNNNLDPTQLVRQNSAESDPSSSITSHESMVADQQQTNQPSASATAEESRDRDSLPAAALTGVSSEAESTTVPTPGSAATASIPEPQPSSQASTSSVDPVETARTNTALNDNLASAVNTVFRGIGSRFTSRSTNEVDGSGQSNIASEMNSELGQRLAAAIRVLERELLTREDVSLEDKPEIITALATAKQVSNVLKGSLNFENCIWSEASGERSNTEAQSSGVADATPAPPLSPPQPSLAHGETLVTSPRLSESLNEESFDV